MSLLKSIPALFSARFWRRIGPQHVQLLVLCVAVGLLSGLGAVLMHYLAYWLSGVVETSWWCGGSGARWLRPAIPLVGIFFCVALTRLLFRRRGYNKSLWPVIREARNPSHGIPAYHMFSHIITAGISVGLGISAGMEAPSALTGAAIGGNIGRRLRLPAQNTRLLLCAGAAAAIGAIFNAPMAGTLFACEVLLPGFNGVMLIPLLIASACGTIVTYYFNVTSGFPAGSYSWQMRFIWQYALIGLCSGLCAVMVIRMSCAAAKLAERVKNLWLRALIGGLFVYLLFLILPALGGQGYNFIAALQQEMPWMLPSGVLPLPSHQNIALLFAMMLLLTLLKPLASLLSLNAGGDGGMFGPSLCTGAFLGYLFFLGLQLLGVEGIPAVNCVAAGMAGVLAGVMHAPLTGLFLTTELLGGFELFVPLMVVVALASFVSRIAAKRNLYAAGAAAVNSLPAVAGVAASSLDELEQTRVSDLAECNYFVLSPGDTFLGMLKLMMKTQQSCFPVVNAQGILVGMIEEKHIRPYILNAKLYKALIVDDFMGPIRHRLNADDTVTEAVELFDRTSTEKIPVVRDGRFIGMLSRTHLIDNYRRYLNTHEWLDR